MAADDRCFLYVLQSQANKKKSYVGVTNKMARRLRQHNGEITGGAKFTRSNRPWVIVAQFKCEARSRALSLEWNVKHRLSRRKGDAAGIEGKLTAIRRLVGRLNSERGSAQRAGTCLEVTFRTPTPLVDAEARLSDAGQEGG